MWGLYPEAMVWNVGDVHSDFNLGERIWSSDAQRANFIVHFEIGDYSVKIQSVRDPILIAIGNPGCPASELNYKVFRRSKSDYTN